MKPKRLGKADFPKIRNLLVPATPDGFTADIAKESDLAEIHGLSLAFFTEDFLSLAKLRFYLNKAHALILTLRSRERLAGYIVLEFNRAQRRIYVVEVTVAQDFRGRGLALWLYQAAARIGQQGGYRFLTSHVKPDNAASLQTNLKAGLEIIRKITNYYDDGSDGLYLVRKL